VIVDDDDQTNSIPVINTEQNENIVDHDDCYCVDITDS